MFCVILAAITTLPSIALADWSLHWMRWLFCKKCRILLTLIVNVFQPSENVICVTLETSFLQFPHIPDGGETRQWAVSLENTGNGYQSVGKSLP
jgi:hypothetical protein